MPTTFARVYYRRQDFKIEAVRMLEEGEKTSHEIESGLGFGSGHVHRVRNMATTLGVSRSGYSEWPREGIGRAQPLAGDHKLPVAENSLNREFRAPAANHVWVSGITYVSTAEGWHEALRAMLNVLQPKYIS